MFEIRGITNLSSQEAWVLVTIGMTTIICFTVIVYQIIDQSTAISDILKRVWEPKERK
jgi:hypothetical protein